MRDQKTFEWAVKSGSVDDHKGVVTAVVSVFGNVDAQNDRVLPGAFAKSIVEWRRKMARNEYLPVVYAHKDDPSYIIGRVEDLRETAVGLEVDEQFFLNKPKARDTFEAILAGVLPKSSFAYDVRKAKSNDVGGLDLAELDVIEVGSTLYAANAATHLVGVKAVDESSWDGNAAMTACTTAADYRSVCGPAERTTGEPDQRAHWALPHHQSPGAPPNADGVKNALGRLPQTQGLKDPAAVRSHLEAHMRAINPDYEPSSASIDVGDAYVAAAKAVDLSPAVLTAFHTALEDAFVKAGREISAKNAALIRQMHDVAHQMLGWPAHDAGDAEESAKAAPAGSDAEEPKVKASEPFPVLAEMRARFA